MPPEHWPLQQSMGELHMAPSGLHVEPHVPAEHVLLQHSLKATHDAPSGLHGGSQMPLLQLLLQHSTSTVHIEPTGLHGPHGRPQTVVTSWTHNESHCALQQNGSVWQIWATHGSHPGESSSPAEHLSWGQGLPPHTPPLHWPLQQSDGRLHAEPAGWHGFEHVPALQNPLQHSKPPTQPRPFGLHCVTHVPPRHVELQHSPLVTQAPPSGVQPPTPQTLVLPLGGN